MKAANDLKQHSIVEIKLHLVFFQLKLHKSTLELILSKGDADGSGKLRPCRWHWAKSYPFRMPHALCIQIWPNFETFATLRFHYRRKLEKLIKARAFIPDFIVNLGMHLTAAARYACIFCPQEANKEPRRKYRGHLQKFYMPLDGNCDNCDGEMTNYIMEAIFNASYQPVLRSYCF